MELERIFDGPALTAAQILQSRTERACRQNALLSQKKYPCLISFTLNIPGVVKQFSLAHAAFQTGAQLLEWELQGHIIEKRLTEAAAGNEALLGVDLPPKQVKQCAVTLLAIYPGKSQSWWLCGSVGAKFFPVLSGTGGLSFDAGSMRAWTVCCQPDSPRP